MYFITTVITIIHRVIIIQTLIKDLIVSNNKMMVILNMCTIVSDL